MRIGHRIALSAIVLVLAAVACGGKKEAAAPGAGSTESSPSQAPSSPKAMAEAIGDIYVEALTRALDILKDRPEAAAAKPKIQELKEKTIQKLVEFGKKKASLSASDKAVIDSTLGLRINTVAGTLFSAYQEAVNYYLSKDTELFNLVGSLNIITQYADFDLLKKQAPEEAKRLGIE